LTAVLRPEITRAAGRGLLGPAVLAGAPTDVRASERKALLNALYAAGAGTVQIVPEPLAAAVGANLDISLPYAQMIVDVGDGVTDCIILRSGSIVRSGASRVGCITLRQRVWQGMRSRWDRTLSAAEAERMMASIGVASGAPGAKTGGAQEDGRGYPAEIRQTVYDLVEPALEEILSVPAALLREVPADVGSEIIESGILLTGGGALIPGLRERLAAATAICVHTPESPLDTVVRGLQSMTTD
jgi:rod shape-determining protein MreB